MTFAFGPTNSMGGAGFLSGLDDALVVDIDGTTTDIGVLARGFPREFRRIPSEPLSWSNSSMWFGSSAR